MFFLAFSPFSGSQARELNPTASNTVIGAHSESNPDSLDTQPPPVKKIVDINEPQTCRNKGCGKTFKEKDNHDAACSYHPGPAVFHDRVRGVRIYTSYMVFSLIQFLHYSVSSHQLKLAFLCSFPC